MRSLRSQTNVEYLIMVAIGVLVVLVAAAGFFRVTNVMLKEYNGFVSYEENLVGVIAG